MKTEKALRFEQKGLLSVNIVIRADASSQIGTGHIIRCLTLAEALRKQGPHVTFITRPLTGNLDHRIKEQGFSHHSINTDQPEDLAVLFQAMSPIDWLIVDHFGLDATWEKACRPFTNRILVIDDLANRPHDADMVLDQNYYIQAEDRYRGRVPETCHVLTGPQYALLRPDFERYRKSLAPRNGKIHRILVSLGGADPAQATEMVIEGIALLIPTYPDFQVDVVVGAAHPAPQTIRQKAEAWGFNVHHDTPHMAEIMMNADLFVGAGGTTTWERLALGLPGIVISIADNHVIHCQALAETGYHLYLGDSKRVTPEQIGQAVATLMQCPELCRFFSRQGLSLVDGQGCTRLVREIIARCREPIHSS